MPALPARARLPTWFARDVLVPLVLTRAALLAVALLAPAVLPRAMGTGVWDPSGYAWLNVWTRWDGLEYLLIAHGGYSYQPGQQSSIAFAPLYPLLLRVGRLLGGDAPGFDATIAVGLVVSNLALAVALGYLVALVRLDFDPATAARTSLYVLLFPTTLFLSALYPESLFLALSTGAFYYARGGRWWLAGVLGGLAALTRPQGALIVLPLALEYASQHRFDPRRFRPELLALALIPAGFALWAAYVYLLTGEPTAVFAAQSAWGRALTPPWQVLAAFFSEPLAGHGSLHSPLDLAFALLFLVLVVLSWWRVRPSYALLASLFYLLMVSSGPLVSLMRNGLHLFPVFIVLALSGRLRVFHWTFVIVSTLLALRFMVAFAQGYWVA